MKNHLSRRILSLVLALTMILSSAFLIYAESTDTEPTTASQEEVESGENAEEAEEAELSFTAESEHYLVAVNAEPGLLPTGAELKVTELTEDSAEYADAKAAVVADKEDVDTVEEFDKNYGFAALDISFYEGDTEVEPDGAVAVSITVKELPEDTTATKLADSLEISHLKEEDGAISVETVATADDTIQVAEETAVAQFEVDDFSSFTTLQWETLTTEYISVSGETYSITVTYGPEAEIPDGAVLEVAELKEGDTAYDISYEEYAEAAADALDAANVEFLRMFDISILADGVKVQPAAPVEVQIKLADAEEDLAVVHFPEGEAEGEELAVAAETEADAAVVTFAAESFSVYTIASIGPDYADLDESSFKIAWPHDGTEDCLSANKYGDHHLARIGYYDAPKWTFVKAKDADGKWDGSYYIKLEGTNRYLNLNYNNTYFNYDNGILNNMDVEVVENRPQKLYVLTHPDHPGKVQIRNGNGFHETNQALNHYNGNEFGLWNPADGDNNSWFTLMGNDLKLGGPYVLVITAGGNKTTALQGFAKEGFYGRLADQQVDIIDDYEISTENYGGADVTQWTFEEIEGTDRYYLKTQDGKYLKIGNSPATKRGDELFVVDDVNDATRVYVGFDANQFPGRIRIANDVLEGNDPGSVDLNANTAGDGFCVYNSNTPAEWFTIYSVEEGAEFTATKISAQDISKENADDKTIKQDDNGRYYVELNDVVVYKSVFVKADDAYEDFMIDGNGQLKKIYDKGSHIMGTSKSPWWTVRIYFEDGTGETPTGYYEFYNPVTGKYLDPRPNDGIVISDEYVGLMMQEKDNTLLKKTTSTIEAWDQETEFNYGLYADNEKYPVELHSGTRLDNQSQEFAFARKTVPDPDELHPVATVDTASAGLIKMTMYDFYDQNEIKEVLGGDQYYGGNHYNDSGNASMRLGADGWPTFADTGKSASELFNEDNTVGPANHLFLQDVYSNTGFYEYSAFNNYAYYHTNGEEKGNFTVYQEIGTPNNEGQYFYKRGNFYPYNPIEPGKYAANNNNYEGDGTLIPYADPRYGDNLYKTQAKTDDEDYYSAHPKPEETYGDRDTNYWFGMTMECDFMIPENGIWNGGEMIYEFNGDDDLWIYIDGVKVLDIGGNHDALPGTINFATGEIKYGANFYTDHTGNDPWNNTDPADLVTNKVPTTIKECFKKAGVFPDGTVWKEDTPESVVDQYFRGDTFKDYSGHSLKMIYAEHGAHASNLYMRFNLPTIPEGSFTVEKKLDKDMMAAFGDREFEYMAFVEGNPNPVIYDTGAEKVESNVIIPWVYKDAEGNVITGEDGKPVIPVKPYNEEYTIKPLYEESDGATFLLYTIRKAELVNKDGTREPLVIDENGIFKLKADQQAVFQLTNNGIKYDVVEVNVPADVEYTTVNGAMAASDNTGWEPKSDIYKNAEEGGINLAELVPGYNERYAPAGESTPKLRAIATFMNKMTPCPLEIEKELSEGEKVSGDRFNFRLWLENQDGSYSPASNVEYYLYEKDGDTWKKVRTAAYTTGNVGTLQLEAEQKAVFIGLLEGTGYVVVEETSPERYEFVELKSENNGEFTAEEWDEFLSNADDYGWTKYGDKTEDLKLTARGKVEKRDNEGEYDPKKTVYTRVTFYNRPTEPHKEETEPYKGDGTLGGVQVGDEITYTISFTNYKSEEATVTIEDTLDPNVEFVEASDGGTNNNGVVTWTLEKVAANTGGTVTLKVKVLEGALESKGGNGKVVNGGDTTTVQVGNDSKQTVETVENPVPESPEKKEVAPYQGTGELGAVKVGDTITYNITYKNYTAETADVVITDTLDPNVEFVSASDTWQKIENSEGVVQVKWTIKDVEPGDSSFVVLTVRVLEGALVSKQGPGEVVNGGDSTTVKVGNDNEFTVNTVTNPVPEPPVKQETAPYEGTGTLGAVKVGDEITYEISFTNYKKEEAAVTINDKLDPNVEYVAESASDDGVYDATSHTITWTIEKVAAGANGTVTFKVKVLEGALKSKGGEGKVVNGGETTTVQIGNDNEYTVETVTNPVPDGPEKIETAPYEGTGELGSVKVGDEITYQISYINYKDAPATVTINDKLDPNVEFVSADHDGSYASGVVTWTITEVPAGGTGSVTLTVRVLKGALVSEGGEGEVVNGGDSTTVQVGNDSVYTVETVTNPVPDGPHKTETKPYTGNGTLGPVNVGDEITYTISYTNYKSEDATVKIKDTLDPNVEFVSASDDGAESKDDGKTVILWAIDVPAGESGSVTLTVKVLEGALVSKDGPGEVVNGGDSTTVQVGNDSVYTVETVENPVPDVPHKKETAPYEGTGELGGVKVGDQITYTISYQNYKKEAATVTINDKLDPNVEFVSADHDGSYASGVVTWTLTDVPAGETGSVTLTVKVLKGALVSEGGEGKVVNGGETTKVQVGNDSEYTVETVENPVPEPPVKKETAPYVGTGELGAVKVGEEITYTISYKNYKSEAADVIITDTLDKNVEFVKASPEDYERVIKADGTEKVVWTLENVDAGKEGTVTLTVKVLEGALEVNKVENGEGTTVKVGNDNEYTVETVTNPVPEEPHKTETVPYEGNGTLGGVQVGDIITYEISYKNYKSTAATVTIKDTLDPNVEFVEASDGGTEVDGVVTWTLEDFAANTEGTVTLKVKVLEGALESKGGNGKVVNGGDTTTVKVGNDNEYTVETVENPVPEPPVKKETAPYDGTGALGAVKVGDQITYEISYKNYKTETANVVIKDTLDPNVKFVKASNNGAFADGVVTWTIANVSAGAEGTVTLTVEVLEGALSEKQVENGEETTVQVGNDKEFTVETVTNPVTDASKKETKITPEEGDEIEAELQAAEEGGAKDGGKDLEIYQPVQPGDLITYVITVPNLINEENKDAYSAKVTITDVLDPNVELVEQGTTIGYIKEGQKLTWTIYAAPGEDVSVTLVVKVKDSAKTVGKVDNQAKADITITNRADPDKKYEFEIWTNEEENPVPNPEKKETEPYEGTGILGAVKVGDQITYEISYWNYQKNAANVTIVDPLDENVDFIGASDDGEYDKAKHTVTWTLKNVDSDKKGTVTLTVEVLPSAKVDGETAYVKNGGDNTTVQVGNDSAFSVNEVENPVPDDKKTETSVTTEDGDEEAKLEKTIPEGASEGRTDLDIYQAVKPGDVITYTISYENYKSVPATVKITDPLDENVTFVSADNDGVYDEATHTVTWTLEDVEAGKKDFVTLKVEVKEEAKTAGKVDNQAFVEVGVKNEAGTVVFDNPIPTNEEENPVPDPHKTETAPYEGNGLLDLVEVGDQITYEISYWNYKKDAADVVIVDALDKNVEFIEASNDGVYDEETHTVTWTLEDVEADERGTVTLTVEVLEGAKKTVEEGSGSVVNGGESTTVQVGNDHAYSVETVENPVPNPEKKETAPYEGQGVLGPVKVGDEITYEITYWNYKGEAADVVITDKLDKNVEFVSASDDGTFKDGVVTWTLKAVEAGKDGVVTLTVKVLEGAQIKNGGTGKVDNGGDSTTVKVGNDNEFTVNTVENPVPDPEKKEVTPYEGTGTLGEVKVGDKVSYTISYWNYKEEAATITIEDKLDPNVKFVSASDGGTFKDGVVTWVLEEVEADKRGTVTLTVEVLEGAEKKNGGEGKIVNGGDSTTVQVDNDAKFSVNTVENPLPEEPKPPVLGIHMGSKAMYLGLLLAMILLAGAAVAMLMVKRKRS